MLLIEFKTNSILFILIYQYFHSQLTECERYKYELDKQLFLNECDVITFSNKCEIELPTFLY
jgi:hypothetical protein